MGRNFIRHVERSGADVFAVALNQIFEPPRIASRCHQTILRREHWLRDAASQSACTACYQPDIGHNTSQSLPQYTKPHFTYRTLTSSKGLPIRDGLKSEAIRIRPIPNRFAAPKN